MGGSSPSSCPSDFDRLNGRLGKIDQQRLDKHPTLVRELEERINVGAYCDKPVDPR